MGSTKKDFLKECSIRVEDNGFEVRDLVKAISDDIGGNEILSCVKTSGYWIVTVKSKEDADVLLETGLLIKDIPCQVTGVSRMFLTVSLFGVPSYIEDEELSDKLVEFGCKLKSGWHRNTYPDFPQIENGTRFIRLELPSEHRSLPYAITVNGVHMKLKHNGQVKVCNQCLGSDHIMRNCPKYACRACSKLGHREANCPTVRCFNCGQLGHKSFNCPDTVAANPNHQADGGVTRQPDAVASEQMEPMKQNEKNRSEPVKPPVQRRQQKKDEPPVVNASGKKRENNERDRIQDSHEPSKRQISVDEEGFTTIRHSKKTKNTPNQNITNDSKSESMNSEPSS